MNRSMQRSMLFSSALGSLWHRDFSSSRYVASVGWTSISYTENKFSTLTNSVVLL